MSVDFLSKNFPPFQVHHAKKPPRFYPDGFQRNVIDFYFIFSDCRLRKALYLQFSYFIWPLCGYGRKERDPNCGVYKEPTKASINKSTHVGQPVFSVLFALLSLAGDSPPASKRTKIPRKSKAVRCEAVLPEQKCSQTRKSPQRILCVFSRALTPYEGISAQQNRVCPCQSTQRGRIR